MTHCGRLYPIILTFQLIFTVTTHTQTSNINGLMTTPCKHPITINYETPTLETKLRIEAPKSGVAVSANSEGVRLTAKAGEKMKVVKFEEKTKGDAEIQQKESRKEEDIAQKEKEDEKRRGEEAVKRKMEEDNEKAREAERKAKEDMRKQEEANQKAREETARKEMEAREIQEKQNEIARQEEVAKKMEQQTAVKTKVSGGSQIAGGMGFVSALRDKAKEDTARKEIEAQNVNNIAKQDETTKKINEEAENKKMDIGSRFARGFSFIPRFGGRQ